MCKTLKALKTPAFRAGVLCWQQGKIFFRTFVHISLDIIRTNVYNPDIPIKNRCFEVIRSSADTESCR